MSFARDPLQEVKKIDASVAARIEKLNLDPAENMLLGAIILDSPIPDKERIIRLNKILKDTMRNQHKERMKECYFLVYGKELKDELEVDYHIFMKTLLRELPQLIIRDLAKDNERVKIIRMGLRIADEEYSWISKQWKNTIAARYKLQNNTDGAKLQSLINESHFIPCNNIKTNEDDEKKTYFRSNQPIARCLTCACYHAVGYCPVVDKEQPRRNRLGTSAIKLIRNQLGLP